MQPDFILKIANEFQLVVNEDSQICSNVKVFQQKKTCWINVGDESENLRKYFEQKNDSGLRVKRNSTQN